MVFWSPFSTAFKNTAGNTHQLHYDVVAIHGGQNLAALLYAVSRWDHGYLSLLSNAVKASSGCRKLVTISKRECEPRRLVKARPVLYFSLSFIGRVPCLLRRHRASTILLVDSFGKTWIYHDTYNVFDCWFFFPVHTFSHILVKLLVFCTNSNHTIRSTHKISSQKSKLTLFVWRKEYI